MIFRLIKVSDWDLDAMTTRTCPVCALARAWTWRDTRKRQLYSGSRAPKNVESSAAVTPQTLKRSPDVVCSNRVRARFLPNYWHPQKSYQNPRALQAEVHTLGVHPLNRLSLGCWTLLCPLNHPNLTFNHSNLTNWPATLTTCPVQNNLMIIWIFLAPHLPKCTHRALLPIFEGMGRPPQRGVHQRTMPSLLCWFGFGCYFMTHVLTMHMFFCSRECTLKQGYPHKKTCTVHRHANAMRNGSARRNGNTTRDCCMKIEFQVALTTEAEPILRKETAATSQGWSGDVWFRRRKKEFDFVLPQRSQHPPLPWPRQYPGQNWRNSPVGFWILSFFLIFFLKENWSLRTGPPPSSRMDFFSASSICHFNYN